MNEENYWQINPDSTSYRFLSRWNESYKLHNKARKFPDINWYYTINVARDFCSYYKDVIKTIFKMLFLGIALFVCLPTSIYQTWLLYNHIASDIPYDNFYANVLFGFALVIGWVEMLTAVILPILILIKLIWERVIIEGGYWIINKIYNLFSKTKTTKQSIIKTWIESKKLKFCKLVKYTD